MSGMLKVAILSIFLGAQAVAASQWTSKTTELEAIFLPDRHSSADLKRLRGLPGVTFAWPVFSDGEKSYLASLGKTSIGDSVKVRLQDRQTLNALNSRKDLRGRFQLNARVQLYGATPDAPHPDQWGLNNTGAKQEMRVTDILSRFLPGIVGEDAGVTRAPAEPADKKTLVAVLDGGIEMDHPALVPTLHRTESECRARQAFLACMNKLPDKAPCHNQFDTMDTDHNGYPLDCSGWDMTGEWNERTGLLGSGEIFDSIGHGTHVAGVIGARPPVSGAMKGLSSQVEILPVRVYKSGGVGEPFPQVPADAKLKDEKFKPAPGADGLPQPSSAEVQRGATFADVVARGILYSIRSNARVLNLSLGYPIDYDSELMRQMVELAQARGILVVAAAGNFASRLPVYPCRYAGVVCVASFSVDGSISSFSDYGDAVDLAAPGQNILSSWPMKFFPGVHTERLGYDFKSGTSYAAPFVAGALARLLNFGMDAREAYARLILGTRPTRPSSLPEIEPKFVLSGNLDLARAFEVTPQPLILPAIKESVFVPLDRQKRGDPKRAEFSLALKNYWLDGRAIEVRVRISPRSIVAQKRLAFERDGATLVQKVEAWPRGETREIKGALIWSAPMQELPGDFYFEVSVSGAGMAARKFEKTVEFFVPIYPFPANESIVDPKITQVATDLTPEALGDDHAIRQIDCPEGASQDYLVITNRSTALQLLKSEQAGGVRRLKLTGGHLLGKGESFFAFSCLGTPQARTYVVTSVNAADKKFSFTYLDSRFRHLQNMPVYSFVSEDTSSASLPEQFFWVSGFTGQSWPLPVFLSVGNRPKAELPPKDPWETRPEAFTNPAEPRLYYVDLKGLHTFEPPQGFRFGGVLRPTATQLARQSVSVLLYKGSSFELEFFTAELVGQMVGAPQKIEFSIYQRLMGLDRLGMFGSQPGGASATAFVEVGTLGSARLSLKQNTGGTRFTQVQPWLLQSSLPGDFINSVVAIFGDRIEDAQAFTRSVFHLYFHDRKSGETLATDMKQYGAVNRHLPARVDGLPALLVPEGQGTSATTEVILPQALDGKVQLHRPASLKTWGLRGCEAILMRSTAFNGAGSGISEPARRMTYLCEDRLIEVQF